MRKSLLSLIGTSIALSFQASAEIEFIYGIKEKVFVQQGNVQPVEPYEWAFGAGAAGNEQLTAVSVTLPGDSTPTPIPNDDGFNFDPDSLATKAELDAAYPNGSISFNITDDGTPLDLGPFSITGDAYPIAPHITNVLELQASDYSQDFLLTWNTFTGAEEGDQILLSIWDNTIDDELVGMFLDKDTTSFNIPGGTLSADNTYDIELLFINETDGLVSPETIIGYISTTNHLLSTHTSDTNLLFYKWRFHEQVATDQVQVGGYQMFARVTGNTKNVSYAELGNDTSNYSLNFLGNNTHLLFTRFDSKAELDAAYPAGEYNFWLNEDEVSVGYGTYFLPGDAYPTAPQFANFTEVLNFDATEEQTISWAAAPGGVHLVQLEIRDQENSVAWSQDIEDGSNSANLPADTLSQDQDHTLIIRFYSTSVSNDKPPTSLGYISSTFMSFQTSSGGGSAPGIEFAYTVKERNFEQTDNTGPGAAFEWSFGSGVQGGNDVSGGSIDYPGGNLVFSGDPGDYSISDFEYSSQGELDAAFPNGSYTLNINLDGSNQALGPFSITGDVYPDAPHITNIEELQAADHTQDFTLTWNAFSGADADDRILIVAYNNTTDDEVFFKFLEETDTSYLIPGGTLTPENEYEIGLIFINDTGGIPTPDTIIGYLSATDFTVTTYTSDTDLVFYKNRVQLQTGPETLDTLGYGPFVFARGNSNSVTYAEINSATLSAPLGPIGPNTYFLFSPLGTKETLDIEFPDGEYTFRLEENGTFIDYRNYNLGPDDYPNSPQFSNFNELQSFDASMEQNIQWETAFSNVTLIGLEIRNEFNQIVWSEDHQPATTSTVIPADTLVAGRQYTLFLRFWAQKDGSEFPDASLGYRTQTNMNIATEESAYSIWLQQFFTDQEILNPEITGPDADPDKDKLNNRFEFLAKLNPIDSSSTFSYDFTIKPEYELSISPLHDGVIWDLEYSPDLQTWESAPGESYTSASNAVRVNLDSFPDDTFFRIILTEQE
ncbi:MAG: hypothetical protein AB3N63_06065 [Puniceicoccaceae bacterium]